MKTVILLLPLVLSAAQTERQETIRREFRGVQNVVVDNIIGFIHVTPSAGDRLEAVIEKHISADTAELAGQAEREVRLDVTEQAGKVRFYVNGPFRCQDGCGYEHGDRHYKVKYDFELRVPRQAVLKLTTVMGGDIDVREIAGDFELSTVNGPIAAHDLEGSGSLRTVNGKIDAWFSRNPRQTCSFRTVNGRIEAWFPPELDANVWFKTMNGGVYTDFEATVLPRIVQTAERRQGKFVYRSDRLSGVRIGKGGPELRFETINGAIHVRSRRP